MESRDISRSRKILVEKACFDLHTDGFWCLCSRRLHKLLEIPWPLCLPFSPRKQPWENPGTNGMAASSKC